MRQLVRFFSSFFRFYFFVGNWSSECRRMFRIFQTVTCQNCESPIFFFYFWKALKQTRTPQHFWQFRHFLLIWFNLSSKWRLCKISSISSQHDAISWQFFYLKSNGLSTSPHPSPPLWKSLKTFLMHIDDHFSPFSCIICRSEEKKPKVSSGFFSWHQTLVWDWMSLNGVTIKKMFLPHFVGDRLSSLLLQSSFLSLSSPLTRLSIVWTAADLSYLDFFFSLIKP